MKISLAGPSYTSASVNAAVQQTMNLVPELIEVPNEPVKMVLYGRPGIKIFITLPQPKIRALWSGGGRLFVVNGSNLSEVFENGTATDRTGSVAQGTGDPDPAQIFSNGHQLMIVSGGKVYVDNGGAGGGPLPALFLLSGTGNTTTTGAFLDRVTGPNFDGSWTNKGITVNGRQYQVSGVVDASRLILNTAPPNENNVPWAISAGAPVDGVTGGFIDGYGVVNRVPRPDLLPVGGPDPGRQFNISGLNDFTYWDPLMFGIKEGRSDYIRSVLCDHEELILFGTESTEIWTNTGAAEFPFQRITGAFINDGSVSTYAPCSVGATFCWLGGTPDGQTRAYRAEGLQPVRISTHAQEWAWNAPGFRIRDAVSFSYIDAGHRYWVVNFWQQQQTWVYDMNTQLWHERATWNAPGSNFLRYIPWYHTFIPEWGEGGKHIVGNPASGTLYEMSSNLFVDDDKAIQYQRAFPHLINENQYSYHHRLEVLMEMGALQSGEPVPLLGLDWSDDHGHTWKTATIGRLMPGAQAGDYSKRAVFRRLGKARDRVYRVGCNARTKVAVIDTFLEATPGFA
jgi:hypothetical protein